LVAAGGFALVLGAALGFFHGAIRLGGLAQIRQLGIMEKIEDPAEWRGAKTGTPGAKSSWLLSR
jgi:hypothetical protein